MGSNTHLPLFGVSGLMTPAALIPSSPALSFMSKLHICLYGSTYSIPGETSNKTHKLRRAQVGYWLESAHIPSRFAGGRT